MEFKVSSCDDRLFSESTCTYYQKKLNDAGFKTRVVKDDSGRIFTEHCKLYVKIVTMRDLMKLIETVGYDVVVETQDEPTLCILDGYYD